jgi:LysM repeat protein
MIRPVRFLGMGLIVFFIVFGLSQKGWTDVKYTVKPGDTLYEISKSFRVSIEVLKKANALQGDSLKLKQVLTIPTEKGNRGSREKDSYVLQRDESPSRISKKVDSLNKEIKKMSGLKTTALKDGQGLHPKDESPLNEEADELEDAEKTAEGSQAEVEKGDSPTSTFLGKWSNPEERGLFVRVVKTFLGVPYRLGGSTLKGMDCSAFVKKIYGIFNIQLPRTAREQLSIGKKVEKDQLKEGDLVFFKPNGNQAHVGIYIGDNQFIHASSYNKSVKIDDLNTPYYSKRFLKGVRVKELEREI